MLALQTNRPTRMVNKVALKIKIPNVANNSCRMTNQQKNSEQKYQLNTCINFNKN